MHSQNVLKKAKKLLNSRKFSEVIMLLQGCESDYSYSVDYYYLFGTACMYLGDIGGASKKFNEARKISVIDTRVLLAQAVIFLRRGDVPRAIEYYLDILDKDPLNKTAIEAMEFIKTQGTPDVISQWVSSGKIKKFYPALGINPVIPRTIFGITAFLAISITGLCFWIQYQKTKPLPRGDLTPYVLTVDERNNALQQDMSGSLYRYILTPRQITESYDYLLKCVTEYRDNAALVEINRLNNSNASALIKQNASMLMDKLSEPTFDTIKDNYSYEKVAEDPYLYINCWVSWTGRIANVSETDTTYSCDLLVGYENQKRVEGIVPLHFQSAMNIDPAYPIRVLGKLGVSEGRLCMYGKSVYQPLDGSSL
ncbi:MAG: tetratricopeptide repeat protein [Spirochaetaceae bacterium]|nr:tetratricopeptide repeat protein [Spirochaetaceae bacterium]MBO5236695.1 tetratricopeptide repeat protein [Spirochaetaceae bacterium]